MLPLIQPPVSFFGLDTGTAPEAPLADINPIGLFNLGGRQTAVDADLFRCRRYFSGAATGEPRVAGATGRRVGKETVRAGVRWVSLGCARGFRSVGLSAGGNNSNNSSSHRSIVAGERGKGRDTAVRAKIKVRLSEGE